MEMTQNIVAENACVAQAQDDTISEFDSSFWGSMVEFITVDRDKEITVIFWDSTEIRA